MFNVQILHRQDPILTNTGTDPRKKSGRRPLEIRDRALLRRPRRAYLVGIRKTQKMTPAENPPQMAMETLKCVESISIEIYKFDMDGAVEWRNKNAKIM